MNGETRSSAKAAEWAFHKQRACAPCSTASCLNSWPRRPRILHAERIYGRNGSALTRWSGNKCPRCEPVLENEGGALSHVGGSCWLRLSSVWRSRARREGKPQTRNPAHRRRTGWHFCWASFVDRTLLLFLVSRQCWLETSGGKPCAPFAAFATLLCHSRAGRDFFVFSITGFMVGTFPFINVHWCSRKRGGDKVGQAGFQKYGKGWFWALLKSYKLFVVCLGALRGKEALDGFTGI